MIPPRENCISIASDAQKLGCEYGGSSQEIVSYREIAADTANRLKSIRARYGKPSLNGSAP
jgi:hypothetical protein